MAYMYRIQSFLIFRFMQFEPRNVIKHMQNSAFTMFYPKCLLLENPDT